MGYSVDLSLSDVRILAHNVPGAIKALLLLMGEEDGESSDLSPPFEEDGESDGDSVPAKSTPYFAWVDNDAVVAALKAGDLVTALAGWRYASSAESVSDLEKLANMSEHADIEIHYFNGDRWGEEEVLWETLAPFIAAGATVAMHGEDDAYWRYVFEDGRIIHQTGHIEWE